MKRLILALLALAAWGCAGTDGEEAQLELGKAEQALTAPQWISGVGHGTLSGQVKVACGDDDSDALNGHYGNMSTCDFPWPGSDNGTPRWVFYWSGGTSGTYQGIAREWYMDMAQYAVEFWDDQLWDSAVTIEWNGSSEPEYWKTRASMSMTTSSPGNYAIGARSGRVNTLYRYPMNSPAQTLYSPQYAGTVNGVSTRVYNDCSIWANITYLQSIPAPYTQISLWDQSQANRERLVISEYIRQIGHCLGIGWWSDGQYAEEGADCGDYTQQNKMPGHTPPSMNGFDCGFWTENHEGSGYPFGLWFATGHKMYPMTENQYDLEDYYFRNW